MHFFSAEKHMLGGNGIVGSQIPVATGVALSVKYKKENGVVLCFFGDGAIHQGAFHESLNLARIWGLPIVYICENNQYGMGTDYRRVSSVTDFSVMGASYGIEGKQLNGMDLLEVYDGVSAVIEKARTGHPGFLDIRTYRYRGHSMSDPAKYRTKEELESYKQKDPILFVKDYLLKQKAISESGFSELDKNAKQVAEQAVQFAESSPEPQIQSLYEDILA